MKILLLEEGNKNGENTFPLEEVGKRAWGMLDKREMVSYKGAQAQIQQHNLALIILLELAFPWISFIAQEMAKI